MTHILHVFGISAASHVQKKFLFALIARLPVLRAGRRALATGKAHFATTRLLPPHARTPVPLRHAVRTALLALRVFLSMTAIPKLDAIGIQTATLVVRAVLPLTARVPSAVHALPPLQLRATHCTIVVIIATRRVTIHQMLLLVGMGQLAPIVYQP